MISIIFREILSYILTKTHTSTRLYGTELLRIFARAKLPDFSKWGIQLLVEQLSNDSKLVAISALSVLDEALDDEVNIVQICPYNFVLSRPLTFDVQ